MACACCSLGDDSWRGTRCRISAAYRTGTLVGRSRPPSHVFARRISPKQFDRFRCLCRRSSARPLNTMNRKAKESGVTLIELLVAITLLSLLSVGMLFAMRVGLNAMGKTNERVI